MKMKTKRPGDKTNSQRLWRVEHWETVSLIGELEKRGDVARVGGSARERAGKEGGVVTLRTLEKVIEKHIFTHIRVYVHSYHFVYQCSPPKA